MHPAIPRLLDLQTVDHHIAALRSELDTFPKRIQEADLNGDGWPQLYFLNMMGANHFLRKLPSA